MVKLNYTLLQALIFGENPGIKYEYWRPEKHRHNSVGTTRKPFRNVSRHSSVLKGPTPTTSTPKALQMFDSYDIIIPTFTSPARHTFHKDVEGKGFNGAKMDKERGVATWALGPNASNIEVSDAGKSNGAKADDEETKRRKRKEKRKRRRGRKGRTIFLRNVSGVSSQSFA